LGTPPSSPQILYAVREGAQFSLLIQTIAGKNYALEFKDILSASAWASLPSVRGNGIPQLLTDPAATAPRRFYRVKQW